jgi:hypothetical protein
MTIPIDLAREALREALFALSDKLRAARFFEDQANHDAYERVVAAFQAEDAAYQALASLPEGWRDIASAPRDGSPILVYREGSIYVAKWLTFWRTWGVCAERIPGDPDPYTDIGDIGFEGHYVARGPTHWMPLPAPPQDRGL